MHKCAGFDPFGYHDARRKRLRSDEAAEKQRRNRAYPHDLFDGKDRQRIRRILENPVTAPKRLCEDEDGMDHYAAKPIEREGVFSMLEKWVKKPTASRTC